MVRALALATAVAVLVPSSAAWAQGAPTGECLEVLQAALDQPLDYDADYIGKQLDPGVRTYLQSHWEGMRLNFVHESVDDLDGGCFRVRGGFALPPWGNPTGIGIDGQPLRADIYVFSDRAPDGIRVGHVYRTGEHFHEMRLEARRGGRRVAGVSLRTDRDAVRDRSLWLEKQGVTSDTQFAAVLCPHPCVELLPGTAPHPMAGDPVAPPSSPPSPTEVHEVPMIRDVRFVDDKGALLHLPQTVQLQPRECRAPRIGTPPLEMMRRILSKDCQQLVGTDDWRLVETRLEGYVLTAVLESTKYPFIAGIRVPVKTMTDGGPVPQECELEFKVEALDPASASDSLKAIGGKTFWLTWRREGSEAIGPVVFELHPLGEGASSTPSASDIRWRDVRLVLNAQNECRLEEEVRIDAAAHADKEGVITIRDVRLIPTKPTLLLFVNTFTGLLEHGGERGTKYRYPWIDERNPGDDRELADAIETFLDVLQKSGRRVYRAIRIYAPDPTGRTTNVMPLNADRPWTMNMTPVRVQALRGHGFPNVDYADGQVVQFLRGEVETIEQSGREIHVTIFGRSGFPDDKSYCNAPELSSLVGMLDFANVENVARHRSQELRESRFIPAHRCSGEELPVHWVLFPGAKSMIWRGEISAVYQAFLEEISEGIRNSRFQAGMEPGEEQ